jgi:NurA domain
VFDTRRVSQALAEALPAFQKADRTSSEVQQIYCEALDQLIHLRSSDLDNRLASEPWPGARSTEEFDRSGLFLSFPERWGSAQQARAWALERLRNVPTVGVDGSQIAASRDFGVPVSLVQVAWFENRHTAERPYVKDVRNEIITPDPDVREFEEYVLAESMLNRRRFCLEMEIATAYLQSLAATPPAVVFIDGTLVLSFLCRFLPEARGAYLQAMFDLLEASQRSRVPVVGYVDLSYARDLVTMLRHAFDLPRGDICDAQIIAPRLDYFDRTAAFCCARGDILPEYHRAGHDLSGDICFVYLKTGQDRLPARLDVPRWVLEAGLLDHVIDIVRGELIVGGGYPYALETADATAVLTLEDRMAFYGQFHAFARASGLTATVPPKLASKMRRR